MAMSIKSIVLVVSAILALTAAGFYRVLGSGETGRISLVQDEGAAAAIEPAFTPGPWLQATDEVRRVLCEHRSNSIEFDNADLQDVAASLSQAAGIPILIDPRSWDEGSLIDTPVTFKGPDGISLRSVLRLILDPLELDYVIRDEVLMITTPKEADALQDTRIYKTSMMQISPETLLTLVTNHVAPHSWNTVSGPGTIHVVHGPEGGLVVTSVSRVHEKIEDLLAQLEMKQIRER